MQILNTKFTLNPFSYTNTAEHEKMDTTSMPKIYFYVLCVKYIYIYMYIYFLTPAHLSVVVLPVYIQWVHLF